MNKFKFFIKFYFPALVWAAVIFYFSDIPGLRYSKSATEEIILRKGAHFVEFFLLTFLFWRIFWKGHKIKFQKAYWLTLFFAGLYGFSDEFHQTLISGRTGKIVDAFFDFFSVVFCLGIMSAYVKKLFSWKNFLVLLLSALILISLGIKMIVDGASGEKKPAVFILKNEINKIKDDFKDRILNGEAKKIESSEEVDKQEGVILKNQNNVEKRDVSGNIPKKFLIDVPFASQAPFKNWDEIHEEACEEASIIMLKYYLEDEELSPEIAEKEIQDLVEFQIKKYGDYKDTDAEQTARLAQDFYGIDNLEVVYDFTREDLKRYLAGGKPIIIPAAGRMLGNPYYTSPGPIYHNLVLIGYNGDMIITNDPGTKRGENYQYNIDVLYNAIHDFPGSLDNMGQGRKAMLVIE